MAVAQRVALQPGRGGGYEGNSGYLCTNFCKQNHRVEFLSHDRFAMSFCLLNRPSSDYRWPGGHFPLVHIVLFNNDSLLTKQTLSFSSIFSAALFLEIFFPFPSPSVVKSPTVQRVMNVFMWGGPDSRTTWMQWHLIIYYWQGYYNMVKTMFFSIS